jgi:predicted nucleic acid-binding protein
VDTSGFFALLVKADARHVQARTVLNRSARTGRRFVTSDFVLDETVTLLKARGHGQLVEPFLASVFDSRACRVEWMDPERFEDTRRFLIKHQDQEWSFTDCFSFFLMHRLHLRDSLTTDKHFRQAGFNPLLA